MTLSWGGVVSPLGGLYPPRGEGCVCKNITAEPTLKLCDPSFAESIYGLRLLLFSLIDAARYVYNK